MQLVRCNENNILYSVSAIQKCYDCQEAHVLALDLQTCEAGGYCSPMVKNFNRMIPPLPTCRSSVKRMSVNFALLCLSDIMIKILSKSQFTVESGSLGDRLLLMLDASTIGFLTQ